MTQPAPAAPEGDAGERVADGSDVRLGHDELRRLHADLPLDLQHLRMKNLTDRDDEEFLRLAFRELATYEPVELLAVLMRCHDRTEMWAQLGRMATAELAARWPGVVQEIKKRVGKLPRV